MLPRGRPPRCVLYTRTLPKGKAGGLNIPAAVQLDRLDAYVTERGYEVLGSFGDQGDAVDGLLGAITSFRSGGVIVTYDVSRLGTTTDGAIWKGVAAKYGTRFEFIDHDPPIDDRADAIVRAFVERCDLMMKARRAV